MVIESNQLIAKLIAKLSYCKQLIAKSHCQIFNCIVQQLIGKTISFQSKQQHEKQTHTRISKLQYQILQKMTAIAHIFCFQALEND